MTRTVDVLIGEDDRERGDGQDRTERGDGQRRTKTAQYTGAVSPHPPQPILSLVHSLSYPSRVRRARGERAVTRHRTAFGRRE
jgi:hypothetical protein